MAEATETGAGPVRTEGWRAFLVFCGVGLGIAALYLASALLFADLGVFRSEDGRPGILRLARFNAALGLVFAYVCASLWLGQRWAQRDFGELRGVVDASEAEWAGWAQQARARSSMGLLGSALLGALAGAVLDLVAARSGYDTTGIWQGHVIWVRILNPALFSAMGVLVWVSAQRSRVYQQLGRRAQVRIGEIAPLAPFVRVGLRLALLWFLGTSLASLLLVDGDSPVIVSSVLAATTAIAVVSVFAPSRGVHERLRDVKREQLGWLRTEIRSASDALRRADAQGAARLPALLAWEARVVAAPEWPFDASTWLRFALFLLVPLASWLGGALAEHFIGGWLGA